MKSESIKLPKLPLPVFSGNLSEWLTFFWVFEVNVRNNTNLSNTQKFHCYKCSLKQEAFTSIQSIAISDTNYKIEWNLLGVRFSNKQEQKFSQIEKLMPHSSL